MTALEDFIFWGIPSKCNQCRVNYANEKKIPPCDKGKNCIVTNRQKVVLNIDEFLIWDDFMDYYNTGEILTTDKWKRDLIILLKNKAIKLQRILEKQNA